MKKYNKFINEVNSRTEEFLKSCEAQEGLTFPQIVYKVNKGEIKIETLGHNQIYMGEKAEEYFKQELNEMVNQFVDSVKKLPDNLVTLGKIYDKLVPGDSFIDSQLYCHDCGARMYVSLIDDKTIVLSESRKYWDISDTKPDRYNFKLTPEDMKKLECEMSKLGIVDKFVAEINVPSGELIFANHFKNEDTYEIKKDKYRSINDLSGRYELMQDLAKRDIGYGQMGNMSVTIFKKKDGTEIIVGGEYGYDESDDLCEFTITHDGYDKLGEISLGVWRWQCGDKKILVEKFGEKISKKLKEVKNPKYHEDMVLANVTPGKWVIEHYYDFPHSKYSEGKKEIYSRLYLKK